MNLPTNSRSLVLICILLLAQCIAGCASTESAERSPFTIIRLSEFYDVESAIVPKTISWPPWDGPDSARVDLSIAQVRETENILRSDYGNHLRRMLDSGRWELPMDETRPDAGRDTLAIVAKIAEEWWLGFRQYHRQYTGRIDKHGHLIVTMRMLKIDDRGSQEAFKHWKEEIILPGGGEIYERNFHQYSIDFQRNVIVD